MGARVIHTQYNLSPLVTHGGITTIHDVSFYHEPAWFKPRDRVLLQRFVPASARRATKVLTVSEFSKREILKYISGLEGKVEVAYNAGNENIEPVPRDDAKALVAKELGLDEPYLLTVGTRWPRKNLNLALRAADRLPASLPHKLVLTGKAGWGDEEPSPRAFVSGFVTDKLLSALYSAADLYLAPALYEGFGITLLEAFQCGCPVLASANGAHEEVAGTAASIESTWQPSGWANSIEKLLGDSSKLNEMRQAGNEQANRFSWRDSAESAERVYREILA
jgi:glycosyltransferase involved in cell wall biosynthesis